MSPFSVSAFRHLFGAQITSLVGTGLTTVALSLLAYDLAGQNAGLVLGSVLTLKMVAYLLIAPVAGGLAHRVPRRIYLVALDVVRAAIVLCLPFVDQIWQIFVLVFVINAASAAFTPVFQAIIPELLDDEETYTKGLSYARFAYDLENLASPALAAILLFVWQFDSLFLVNGVTFLLSAILIVTATIPKPAQTDRVGGIYENTLFGVVAYLKTPRLRGLLAVYFAVSCVGAMIIVNTVVLTQSVLGGSDMMTTAFLACAGAGSMIAAFLIPRIIDRLGERRLMLSGVFLAAAAMLIGGTASMTELGPHVDLNGVTSQNVFSALFYAALWAIAGAGTTFAQTPGGRLVQRSAAPGDRSAFFAANFALSHGGWLVAYAVVGWVGALLDLSVAFWVSGGLALLGGALALRAWPANDPTVIHHSHPGFWHDHPHDHNDPHHSHGHADTDADAEGLATDSTHATAHALNARHQESSAISSTKTPVHAHDHAGDDPRHRHKHFHPPVTHQHRFVIDSHHSRWPVESGDQV